MGSLQGGDQQQLKSAITLSKQKQKKTKKSLHL